MYFFSADCFFCKIISLSGSHCFHVSNISPANCWYNFVPVVFQASISSVDGEINGRLDRDLRYHCTASDVLSYWGAKFKWPDPVVLSVELEGTGRAIKRLPEIVAARICKLRCGWLPVNEREARQDPDRVPGCSACSAATATPTGVANSGRMISGQTPSARRISGSGVIRKR